MSRDDDPKLFLDDNEWRCYKRATRNLRHQDALPGGRNLPSMRGLCAAHDGQRGLCLPRSAHGAVLVLAVRGARVHVAALWHGDS